MSDVIIEDPRMLALVEPGARVERLWTGAVWSEGPLWWSDGSVTWSDIPNNRMLQWHPETGGSVFRQPSNHSNGHTRDREGRLVSCEHSGRRISRKPAGAEQSTQDEIGSAGMRIDLSRIGGK